MSLVATRFLTLTAHLVIIISIFQSRRENVTAALPLEYTVKEYDDKDQQLIAVLSLSIACLLIEYVGFLSGISAFRPAVALISSCIHSGSCVAMGFFIWDVWPSDFLWYTFPFMSLFPALYELSILIPIFACQKSTN